MKKISILGLSVLLLAACTDLETEPGGKYVTSSQLEEMSKTNPGNMISSSVNAIFASFKEYMPITGGGAERHNDFGYPSIMMFTDNNGFDMVSEDNGYNWSGNELDYTDRVYTSYESEIVWNTMYQMIFAANNVISKIDSESPDPTGKLYAGNIQAVRAFCYWNLAQLYQFNYVDHKSDPCVPIITEANADDAAINGCPRATVEQVYDQILSDINAAVSFLEFAESNGASRDDRRFIDLATAYGIRARINLTMENWAAAAEDAQKAIDNSDAEPSSLALASRPAFMDIEECNWMWGILVDETDRIVTSGIVNFPSHLGSFNYGYCWYSGGRQISKKLFNLIPETDVRKGWFLDDKCFSKNLTEEELYVMNDYVGYAPYTQVKFAPYNNVMYQDVNASDIPLMRIEEMYLIKAEGLAMSGNTTDAVSCLNTFVSTYRDPEYNCTLTDAAAIQNEVWNQRRVELWGEGLAWFDIMRLKKGVDRRGCGYNDATAACIFNIAPDDPILLWRLPESEIQANKQISDKDNNETVPAPEPVDDIE